MPTLHWIGKEAVVKHHKDVPYRLLEPVAALSCTPSPFKGEGGGEGKSSPSLHTHTNSTENLIVQGDNLHALKALLPRYAGQVKCIYIDPPYNTGNEGWVYNDNVNSAEIKRWLGEVVGKEGETLDRHDRWLCMMYPRLLLLKQFLREDGVIFVSIDDVEVATLRLLLDEIFGSGNFVANFVWEKRKNRENRKVLSIRHDHVICYAKNSLFINDTIKPLPMDRAALARYTNSDNDPRGPWKSDPATAQSGHGTNSQFYTLTVPNGKKHSLPSGRCWVFTQDVMHKAIEDKKIWLGTSGNNVPRIKTFLHDKERGLTPETILFAENVSTNESAKNGLKEIFGGEMLFETPKPVELINHLIKICTSDNDLILDSFSGAGTTAHAVLKQNAEDGGNRRFILVEMDENIAQNVTAERVKRVAQGYVKGAGQSSTSSDRTGVNLDQTELNVSVTQSVRPEHVEGQKWVAGLGGGFQFCKLSAEPLFTALGQIRSDVTFAQLAEFVWFVETGTGFTGKANSPLIGVHQGRAIYLLYNGILKDKSVGGGNVLTTPVLDILPKHNGAKVIFAAANRLGAPKLAREQIVFKQTPYALDV